MDNAAPRLETQHGTKEMANLVAAGVTTREIDLTGPRRAQPTGIPAGVIGTSQSGPAFVPVTLATLPDFFDIFGMTDGKKFGPYAVVEWLRNASAITFLRVLGAGDGKQRTTSGNNQGRVTNAGFVVGQELSNTTAGAFAPNPYANSNGALGRTYFLGCYMSESRGSTYLSDAGVQLTTASAPIIRGVLFAASGVIPRLSSSQRGTLVPNNGAPLFDLAATVSTTTGSITGSVVLAKKGAAMQEFTILLNGFKGTDLFDRTVTASFDPDAKNYFANVLNRDPLKFEESGHYLYTHFDIHAAQAQPTGSGVINAMSGSGGGAGNSGVEEIAFLTTGTLSRNVGSSTEPNYENFEDRFTTAKTPFFISQTFGGSKYDLFKLHAKSDGSGQADKLKVSIENITPSTDARDKFGTFDVVVRDMGDTDSERRVLEAFRGCSLDQSSDRFIAKIIGDQRVFFNFDTKNSNQRLVVDGDYESNSKYVRVELSDALERSEVPDDALPIGFRGHEHLVTSGSAPLTTLASVGTGSSGAGQLNGTYAANILKLCVQPPVPIRKTIALGEDGSLRHSSDLYWGVQFELPDDVNQLNKSTRKNATVTGYARQFPNFHTAWANVVTGSNAGQPDSDADGVLDSDRFLNNSFTLESVKVVTASGDVADVREAKNWAHVRQGNITANAGAKTRAFDASKDLGTPESRSLFKFSTFMQGGWDGVNIFDKHETDIDDIAVREEIDNTNRGLTNGPSVASWNKAIRIMKNTSDVDVKLLALPGMRHPNVTDEAILAAKERFDAVYIMDVVEYDNLNTVVTGTRQTVSSKNTAKNFKDRALDNSFAAVYFPDVVVTDENNTAVGNVQVPPSVAVLGAYALNDKVGHPWFAPAGRTRGRLLSALEPMVKLNGPNLDELYAVDINPLVSRPGDNGVIVWGQKTLQTAKTSFDRVSVRRLLIEVRRQARDVANRLLFEPNRASTLRRFSDAMEPRLEQIRKQSGLDASKIQIDTSTTSPADVANLTIRGKIWIRPTKTQELISLDFVVSNADVTGL